ncbi:carbohydrate ABC transporter permease [Anaerocolumna xylanovorans]|uniref:Raffinose/stachyose/melibiose transport system permease protein n=1 Tax=Anaerocolumna xylanovorans DSM 12503 TaxID=1121345 RepID=A0A1M7Y2B3_9FIRM|nr:sugar ABC transporter permease [Anaerocolumna xylanovorans]SHO46072.1 raffinose/stachyose/melibiose transport system permease protein [Anaerocolumna xylanovorans DSM 12503]
MSSVKKRHVVPYLFIIPAFIIHVSIVTAPAFSTLVMSLFDWNGMGNAKFIGIKNFKEIFQDSIVKLSIMHNIQWLLIFITVPLILGFTVAIIVSQLGRTQMFFRTVYFIPYIISAAVAGKIWTAYMNPYYGLNQVFDKLGWEGLAKVLWLGNPKIALYSVAFVDNWHWWGFILVLFLGALQQVDSTLYEAARVDGASRFQELLHVSIPGIKQTIAFVLIMTIMWSFLTFDYVYIMTNGGPANSTEIMSTYIYKNAFVKYRAGYANALCVIQSGVCVLLYFLQKYISKKGGMEDE